MQVCHRVLPWRIVRHNWVLDLVEGWLRMRDFQVTKEPRIATNQGLKIPDITCHKDNKAYVTDVQVCSDSNSGPLAGAHHHKVEKYSLPEIECHTQQWSGVATAPTVSSVTVSWRGIMAPDTLSLFNDLQIPSSSMDILVARTLRFGLHVR